MHTGILYLCPTPIGNLEDITLRALRVLREADVVAAEDTRHSRKLLTHFEIHKPLVSYHEHNKAERGPELLQRLLAGESIALVSDAGMPGIADPGADLVRLALDAGVTVIPLPGANAALTSLIASGLSSEQFQFLGFLPKTTKKRRALLEEASAYPGTLIFYEAPHRLLATLKELQGAFGNRQAVAVRELTKKFEEFVRGDLVSIEAHFKTVPPRGEFTLLCAGAVHNEIEAALEADPVLKLAEAIAEVGRLVAAGENKKDAIRMIASQKKLSRRDLYQAVIKETAET